MPPKKSPKSSAKTPSRKPAAAVRKSTGKTAEEVRKLVRAGVTKDGATLLSELASDDAASHILDWISTQSVGIDGMLETPGIPCGRITEIYGKNHSGKSTFVAHLAAECQRRGGVAYLVDQDNTADKDYFARIGVDPTALELIEAKDRDFESVVEGIEKTVDELVKHDILAVIIYDDIAAVETKHDLEAKFSKVQPGGMAKGIRGMCRRLLSKIARSRIAIVVTNQTYSKVGVVFGNPEVPFGGDGLGIFASVRLAMKKAGKLPAGIPGTLSRVQCVKSKVSAASGKEVDVAIAWARGFDNTYNVYETLLDKGMISQSGNTRSVKLSETEDAKWVGEWPGLARLCAKDHAVFERLADAYRALTAPKHQETTT